MQTKSQAIVKLSHELVNAGNVVFLDNDNVVCSISSEIDKLESEYAPEIVCDYRDFKFYGVSEVIATGEDAVDCFEASRGDEYEQVTLCKSAGAYSDEIVGIDPSEARQVCEDDPDLIYLAAFV